MDNKEKLIETFNKNSDKMLEELEKGMEITIKKNKEGFAMYSKLMNKIK